MTDMAPDKAAGVVPIVYMTSFPPFGGGVHSMVTSDCPIPWMGGGGGGVAEMHMTRGTWVICIGLQAKLWPAHCS